MIFEHEIPSGSRLYFGRSAQLKRQIENIAVERLEALGFEEIVTPIFSYHQHESFSDLTPLIRLNDAQNYAVTLRADSTVDVVRIVTKRLGRSMLSKRWFYVQPTVVFPTKERHQVGAEVIGGTFGESINTTIEIVKALEMTPILQLANIRIPHLLSEKYGVSLELLRSMNIERLLESALPWMERLVRLHSVEELSDLTPFPEDIAMELGKIKEAAAQIRYDNIIVSPLYYAKMRYYDSLTFKMFESNRLLAMGGVYVVDGIEAAGFALYTDECIAYKLNRAE